MWLLFFFFKQKSAYERRISDWISDVCSSDLGEHAGAFSRRAWLGARRHGLRRPRPAASGDAGVARPHQPRPRAGTDQPGALAEPPLRGAPEPHLFPERLRRAHRAEGDADRRSEEHTSELQSLMRISYAVLCLKKKNKAITNTHH